MTVPATATRLTPVSATADARGLAAASTAFVIWGRAASLPKATATCPRTADHGASPRLGMPLRNAAAGVVLVIGPDVQKEIPMALIPIASKIVLVGRNDAKQCEA